MTMKKFIPYAHQSINATDIQSVSAALLSDFITRGPTVEVFEQQLASYCGAKYGVAFSSGTAGLIAAAAAAQLGPYDRVITTPNTFVATVNAGLHRGATPVFIDIDLETGNMNLEQLEINLKQPATRGRTVIMPVHFAGIPVDMKKIDGMICDPDTIVIEDAAHALGSHYLDGQKVGCCAWSHMTLFSFHPAKQITTGEGGMVMTNDDELYRRLKSIRNNGIERDPIYMEPESADLHFEGYYEVVEMSNNYNFTEFQAALGISQLKRLDEFVAKRRQLIRKYRQLLDNIPNVRLFSSAWDDAVSFHLCVAQINFANYNTSRAHVMTKLKEAGIGSQVHYIPVYHHPFFKKKNGDLAPYFPNMESYYAQAISLPLYFDLNMDDVEYVVHTLKKILETEKQKKSAVKHHKGRQHHTRRK